MILRLLVRGVAAVEGCGKTVGLVAESGVICVGIFRKTFSMAEVTSRKPSSRVGNFVIALPSFVAARSFPNKAPCQLQGRNMTGITTASPSSCLSIARFISMS